MSNSPAVQRETVKDLFGRDYVVKKFHEILGKKAQGFITSVLQAVASNNQLAEADPITIYNAAAQAAVLDLPINNNLGFAYLIPYNQKQPDGSYKKVCQFQVGYKGFIQLAQRSGQIKTIAATPIYEGQLVSSNPLTGYVFDFAPEKKLNEKIIGFAAYFALINGFEKVMYMTLQEMEAHGLKFSKTFKNENSLWKKDFVGMGNKTVIKLLISKFAPCSIEMQKAIIVDQAMIGDDAGEKIVYVDNEETQIDKEEERMQLMIQDCKTLEDLDFMQMQAPEYPIEKFDKRRDEIKAEMKKKSTTKK